MEKEEKDLWTIGQRAKDFEEVAMNTETKEGLTQLELVVKMANDIEEIKKALLK